MNTKNILFIFNRLFTTLMIIFVFLLAGCSPKYINIFSTKPTSNDSLIVVPYEIQTPTKNDEEPPEENSEIQGVITYEDSENMDMNQNEILNPQQIQDNPLDLGADTIDNDPLHDIDDTNNLWGNEKVEAIPVANLIRNANNKELKRVALTFDDGPDDYFTPKVLDILGEYNAKATFFVLGSAANNNKDVLKRIAEEGHVVGSHSWGHKNFTKISEEERINELKRTDDLIKEVIGSSSSLFRLPYGANNKGVLNTVANQGYHNIYWSIDPKDWSGKSPDQILANIKQNIEPGAIILLHSSGNENTIPNTIKALPRIIEFLLEEDYEIVTIPKLLLEDIYE